MLYNVFVSFGAGKEYEFPFEAAEPRGTATEQARHWLDEQYVQLECEPINPMGKTLIIDKVLIIAKAAGEKPFAANDAWAQQFARSAALALGRDTIRIDVPGFTVGH